MNSRVREYATLASRLKQLILKDQGDSDAAEFIRETLDDCWRSFSDEDVKEVESIAKELEELENSKGSFLS